MRYAVICACLPFALGACADIPGESIDVVDVERVGGDLPAWEDFKAAATKEINGQPAYVVESDILLSSEEQLLEFYRSLYVDREKSIVNLVGGNRDLRAAPHAIRYCFSDGWGMAINCTPAGNPGCYTAPALNAVRTNIRAGMDEWEQVANVYFVYMNNLDGAGCNTSGMNPGVDFVITHYNNASTAVGPFPSNGFANQQLLVPTSGITRLLAIHEVGHVLGLRHEHIHTGAMPRCTETGTVEQLTAYDNLSCMRYANCTTGSVINGTEISVLDGFGSRILYGAPARWFPAYNLSVL